MLTNRLTSTLKIQASETHRVALVAMQFALVELSCGIGGSACIGYPIIRLIKSEAARSLRP